LKTIAILGMSIALSACAQAPELPGQAALAPAARSDLGIRNAPVPDLTAGYTARAVTGPGDWRALNDRQAPQNKGGN
jgi:hypothetical protein